LTPFLALAPCFSLQLAAPALQGEFKMVTIRLTRRGGKKTPFYHVVVTDSRKRQGGTSLESVGLFNPVARGAEIKLRLDVARIEHWVGEGAHMSDRVKQLLTVVPQAGRLAA
jgi:small subunit ribosomal protein S16